jgi:hypothetical protein
MVREVVDHGHAARLAADLLAALHATEAREGGRRLLDRDAESGRGGKRAERVLDVEAAVHRQHGLRDRAAAAQDLEARAALGHSPTARHSGSPSAGRSRWRGTAPKATSRTPRGSRRDEGPSPKPGRACGTQPSRARGRGRCRRGRTRPR